MTVAADSFENTSGLQVWDVASNWTGGVPQSGDDVSIVGPTTGIFQVTISDTDPAYTVQSLKFVSQSPAAEGLLVNGGLTVTGTTVFDTADLFVREAAVVSLQEVTIDSARTVAAQIEVGSGLDQQTATLRIATLSGTGAASLGVFPGGTAYIGAAQGTIAFTLQGATLSVGSTSGTDTFKLYGGNLTLGTTATELNDTLLPMMQTGVDLANVAYQLGESAFATLTSVQSGNYFYTVGLKSLLGQTLFTFNNVEVSGSTLPVVAVADDGSGGTLLTVACYCRGTSILTLGGEVPVEDLRVGDLVVTFAGKGTVLKPVRWMGHRRIDLWKHPDPENTHPIRFRAGALGEGCPRRDLLVSPGHRMRIDDVLVTALELVNGATIAQENPGEAEYWHIELDGHDLVLAEGVQAETYVDIGNRSAFENAAIVAFDAVLDGDAPEPCLPYFGASAAVRARLIARAEAMDWTKTIDPAPWLEVNGQRIEPLRHRESYRFMLPAICNAVRLCSRAGRPWNTDPHSGDRRQLGLKLHHLALGNRGGMQKVALDAPGLSEGFSRVERDETGFTWRWTNGDALLPLAELAPNQPVTVVEIAYEQALPMWMATEPTGPGAVS